MDERKAVGVAQSRHPQVFLPFTGSQNLALRPGYFSLRRIGHRDHSKDRRQRFYQNLVIINNMIVLNNHGVRIASDQLIAWPVQQYGHAFLVIKSSE
jgi:hypothetical protein